MKKITLLTIALVAFGISSCKKDFTCECTHTTTDASGNIRTDPMANTTYRDLTKSEAKSLCQKSTTTDVDASGGTTISVYDCKLK